MRGWSHDYSEKILTRSARADRLAEHRSEYPSQWAAVRSIAQKCGINTETVRNWVQQAERDSGQRIGLTTDEKQRLKELEKEVKELRRANEILKAASAFFGAELDRRHRR